MRILHLDSGREMRGGQWQVLHLLRGLTAAGWSVTLLARSGCPLYKNACRGQIDVRPLNVVSAHRLSRTADLTHAHDARSHTIAALVAGSPLIVSRRVAFPLGVGLASRWKYGRSKAFIAISEATRQSLVDARIDPSKITVVADGVEIPDLPGFSPTGPIIALDSRDPLKGRDIVEAARLSAGVEVEFSADLSTSLRCARCFVYLTRQEGLGSAALMAMAAGIPVIASRVGGLPEIVRHEETGLLTENSIEAVTAAIRRLEGDPILARQLGESGRKLVASHYRTDDMVRGTVAVYERTLSCSKR